MDWDTSTFSEVGLMGTFGRSYYLTRFQLSFNSIVQYLISFLGTCTRVILFMCSLLFPRQICNFKFYSNLTQFTDEAPGQHSCAASPSINDTVIKKPDTGENFANLKLFFSFDTGNHSTVALGHHCACSRSHNHNSKSESKDVVQILVGAYERWFNHLRTTFEPERVLWKDSKKVCATACWNICFVEMIRGKLIQNIWW